MSAAPGEIRLEHASRSFTVRGDRGRTLKELFIGRRKGEGPAPIQALDDVSLHVAPGETVGMVGRNGAGKSSTLRVLAGIVPLHSGRAECGGRVISLLELSAGFGREFSGRENVYVNGALHGLSRPEVEERVDRIVAFSELGEFMDVPVKTYSSGMLVRLGFSIAAHLDADVLLIDEVLAVGDEAFQRKCLRRISERIATGSTLVLVSHDPSAIERVCERVVVLDGGRLVFDGPTADGLLYYHRLMGTEHGLGASSRPQAGGPLSVADAELQDEQGRRRSAFRTGDPLRLEVALAARGAVVDARLVLEVRNSAGDRIFHTETRPDLGPDGARLLFEVPRMALLGGDYDVALGAGAGEAPVALDRLLRFSVVHEEGGEGVVDLRGRWRAVDRTEVAG